MMNRKLFFTFIAVLVLLLFIYSVLQILVLRHTGFSVIPTAKLKDLIALLIIVIESKSAKKTIQKFSIALMLISVFAFVMKVMHWPFANILFFGSLLINLALLIVNAIKSNNPSTKLLVLVYPVARVMLAEPFFYMSSAFWMLLEVYVPGIFAGLLLWFRKKI